VVRVAGGILLGQFTPPNHGRSDTVVFGQLLQCTTPEQIGAAVADVRDNETALVRQAGSTHSRPHPLEAFAFSRPLEDRCVRRPQRRSELVEGLPGEGGFDDSDRQRRCPVATRGVFGGGPVSGPAGSGA
jgi:hypothetical protein